MQRFSDAVLTVAADSQSLIPYPNGTITVYPAGIRNTVAEIFTANNQSSPGANPFQTDQWGNVDFYARNGRYDIVITRPGMASVVIPDVLFYDPADDNFERAAQAINGDFDPPSPERFYSSLYQSELAEDIAVEAERAPIPLRAGGIDGPFNAQAVAIAKNLELLYSQSVSNISLRALGAPMNGTGDDAPALVEAIGIAVANNLAFINADGPRLRLNSLVDFQGVGIRGSMTDILNTANTRNVGALVGCIVRGHRTDVDYYGPTPPGEAATHKVLERAATGTLNVLMMTANGRYVRCEHQYNAFTSGASDTGGSSQNWRFTRSVALSAIRLYKGTPQSTVGTWSAPTAALISQTFPGAVSARQMQYITANAVDAEAVYEVIARTQGQRSNVAIYATASSTETVEISVNGVLTKTVSARLTDGYPILIIDLDLTRVGANTIGVKKKGAGPVNVFGVNLFEIDRYAGQTIDALAYGETNQFYTTGNGANDYAFFSVAQAKWFGSVHGGETERAAPVLTVDGAAATIPAVGAFLAGKSFTLVQSTEMRSGTDYMNVDSVYTYAGSGYSQFDCVMSGDCTVKDAYTCMSTTDPAFAGILYPVRLASYSAKTVLGRYDTVVQSRNTNPTNRLTLTTQFSLFPMGGATGANMSANGPYVLPNEFYNKVYYGPCVDSPSRLRNLAFFTRRVFS